MSEALTHHEYVFPADLKYSEGHSWVKRMSVRRVRIGVTDFAQRKLRAVVFVDPPRVGTKVKAGDVLATLESIEAVSEVHSPVSGTVAAYNEALDDDPSLVNRDPYGGGWIAEMDVDDPSELEGLLSAGEYLEKVVKRGLAVQKDLNIHG